MPSLPEEPPGGGGAKADAEPARGAAVTERRLPALRALARRNRRAHPSRTAHPADLLGHDAVSPRSSVVDSAVYVDGDRVSSPTTLADTYERLREHPDSMAW